MKNLGLDPDPNLNPDWIQVLQHPDSLNPDQDILLYPGPGFGNLAPKHCFDLCQFKIAIFVQPCFLWFSTSLEFLMKVPMCFFYWLTSTVFVTF
jgi:hypothetical protein